MREFAARLQFVTQRSFPEPSEWLTAEELRTFQRIKARQRRQDWLAGRWAAKKLIRRYLLETVGLELVPSQIRVLNDAHGAPYVDLSPWPPSCLSLAHSAGYGFAGFSPHGTIGVDLQQIRPVRPDLARRILSEHERAQLAHSFAEHELEGLLVFWALKEAAVKAWRTRPAPALREIAVTLTELGHAEISLRTQRLKARWGRWGEFIWACAQVLT